MFAVTKRDACLLKKDRNCASLSYTTGNNISPNNTPTYTAIFFGIKFCPLYLQ